MGLKTNQPSDNMIKIKIKGVEIVVFSNSMDTQLVLPINGHSDIKLYTRLAFFHRLSGLHHADQ